MYWDTTMFYVHPAKSQPHRCGGTNWGVWCYPRPADGAEVPPICVADGYATRTEAEQEALRLNTESVDHT